jgi:hypothetical protein
VGRLQVGGSEDQNLVRWSFLVRPVISSLSVQGDDGLAIAAEELGSAT